MTQKALIECLSTIDSHFGKQPSPEARRAEIQVYISVLGNIPDEIALKALPAALRSVGISINSLWIGATLSKSCKPPPCPLLLNRGRKPGGLLKGCKTTSIMPGMVAS